VSYFDSPITLIGRKRKTSTNLKKIFKYWLISCAFYMFKSFNSTVPLKFHRKSRCPVLVAISTKPLQIMKKLIPNVLLALVCFHWVRWCWLELLPYMVKNNKYLQRVRLRKAVWSWRRQATLHYIKTFDMRHIPYCLSIENNRLPIVWLLLGAVVTLETGGSRCYKINIPTWKLN